MVRTTVYHGSLSPALCVYVCRASERAFSLCTLFLIHWLCEKRMCVCAYVCMICIPFHAALSLSLRGRYNRASTAYVLIALDVEWNQHIAFSLNWAVKRGTLRVLFPFVWFGNAFIFRYVRSVDRQLRHDCFIRFLSCEFSKVRSFLQLKEKRQQILLIRNLAKNKKICRKRIGRSTIQTVSYHLNVLWALKWVCACLIHFNVRERQLNYTKILYDAVDKHVKENQKYN